MTDLEQFTNHLETCQDCNENAPMLCREGERLLTHTATGSTKDMRASLMAILGNQIKPPAIKEDAGRPLSLIEAEFLDASQELAGSVREQAGLMLTRADGIIRSTKEIVGQTATDTHQSQIKMQEWKNQWDLSQMKEQELTLRMKRLHSEWSMRTGK